MHDGHDPTNDRVSEAKDPNSLLAYEREMKGLTVEELRLRIRSLEAALADSDLDRELKELRREQLRLLNDELTLRIKQLEKGAEEDNIKTLFDNIGAAIALVFVLGIIAIFLVFSGII